MIQSKSAVYLFRASTESALLNELSRNNIKGVKYFELAACEYGCVGGVFNVVNPFQARYDLRDCVRKGRDGPAG